METIFLAFSITNSSISDFYLELALNFSKESKVIIFTDRIERADLQLSKNIEVLIWPSTRPKKIKDFIFLYKNIRLYNPKTMISNFGSVNIFLIMGFLFNVKNRIAWCHTLSSQFESKKILTIRKQFVYKLATKIIANSNATKSDLIKDFCVESNKIYVSYNAVKENKFINETNPNLIVYAGRIHSSKGIETLINAFAIVTEQFPLLELHILGGNLKSDAVNQLKILTHQLNIEKKVIFRGNQTQEKVLEVFSKAYLTVVPSLVEAFGYVVIESFSVRTPVIGSNTTGIVEIVRDGVDGYLFTPQNTGELSDKIITLLKNPKLRKEFSFNCYQRFLDNFELKESVRKLSVYLNKI